MKTLWTAWTAVLRNGSRRSSSPSPTPTLSSSKGNFRTPAMKTRIPLFRLAVCAALLNFSVPGGALVSFGVPLREGVQKGLAARAKSRTELAARRAKSASRLLTVKEERTMQGRTGENPYLAGQSKWDVVYKGVNLMTGNYSMSATDMSFDGGYGIPVNVTRSYSANNPDEGPFGKGWTLSADVRSTAGGLLKSGGAPVRSVPFQIKERPQNQDDPNVAVEPAAAVTVTDAGGTEETVQKDVDGILTTPAWDKNVYDSVYEWVTLNGQRYQVLLSNTVKTPEGTVYTYAKRGSFPNGTRPWDQPNATPEAANVLKVTSATDRQGNVTTYSYSTGTSTYQKSNGTVVENRLTRVEMPGGHVIRLNWGTNPSVASFDRITSVDDDLGGRTVAYGYVGAAGHGLLASATTPGGKTTGYGYGAPYGGGSSDLLTSITDPRGLTETIKYLLANVKVQPYRGLVTGIVAYGLLHSNGTSTFYQMGGLNGYNMPPDAYNIGSGAGGLFYTLLKFVDCTGTSGSYIPYQGGEIPFPSTYSPSFPFFVLMNDWWTQNAPDGYTPPIKFATSWEKDYDPQTQNLITENHQIRHATAYPRQPCLCPSRLLG